MNDYELTDADVFYLFCHPEDADNEDVRELIRMLWDAVSIADQDRR